MESAPPPTHGPPEEPHLTISGALPLSDDQDDREAEELHQLSPAHLGPPHELEYPTSSATSPRSTSPLSRKARLHNQRHGIVRRLWTRHISMIIPQDTCRDHFANERTFLAYLRTSLALSIIGAIVAQLFRLQHNSESSSHFGYYQMSKPVAGVLQVAAICLMLIGAQRFFNQQNAMARGKCPTAGWEFWVVVVGTGLILILMLAVVLGADILFEYFDDND